MKRLGREGLGPVLDRAQSLKPCVDALGVVPVDVLLDRGGELVGAHRAALAQGA